MSHVTKKGKDLSTRRNTNKLSNKGKKGQQNIGQNSSLFDSFISIRTSKEQTDDSLLSSTRNSPTTQGLENDVFNFSDKKSACFGESSVLLKTKFPSEKNVFEEETKIEEGIQSGVFDNADVVDDFKPNESSLFFESSLKINADKCKITTAEKNIRPSQTKKGKITEDNNLDDTVPIPVLPGVKTLSSLQDVDENVSEEPEKSFCDTINQCPVCLKTFGSDKYFSHLKSCATKNKLNTQQLLSALRLHKKQLAERKELGLGFNVQNYKARISPKRPRNNQKKGAVDSSLQLALALSASLHSAQEDEVIQEAEALKEAGLCEEAEQKLSTLEKYGFASDGPLQPRTLTGGLKSCQFPPSLLLRRTQEERERIVTEKVAIILISEDENTVNTPSEERKPVPSSKVLKEKWDEECQLWNKSRCPEDEKRETFYVKPLSQFVSPSKGDIGDGLRRLSQLPGRINTPMKENYEDLTPCKILTDTVENDISNPPTPLRTDVLNREMKLDLISLTSLSNDFRKLINNDELSDFNIHCNESNVVPAHKIVFYARCPRILHDLIKQSNGQEILDWGDYSVASVMAFLEYVYCGKTDKILMLDIPSFVEVKNIADNLDCTELKTYLNEAEKLSTEANMTGIKKDLFRTGNSDKIPNFVSQNLNDKDLEEKSPLSGHESKSKSEKILSLGSPLSLCSEDSLTDRESPDMFGDSFLTDNELDAENERNDLDMLVSLIGKPTQTRFDLHEKINSTENFQNVTSCSRSSSLRSEVFSGKRKASTISSGDEDESLSKKRCSDLSRNECFDSNNIGHTFDLTLSSNSSDNNELCKEDDDMRNVEDKKHAISDSKNIEGEIDLTQDSKYSHEEASDSCKFDRKKSEESYTDESFVDLTQSNCDESNLKNVLSSPIPNEGLIDPILDGFSNEDCNYAVSTPKSTLVKSDKDNSVTYTTHSTPQCSHANTSKNVSDCYSHERLPHSHDLSVEPSSESMQDKTSCVLKNDNGQDFIDPVWEGFDDYYPFPDTNYTYLKTPSKYLSKELLNSSSPCVSSMKKSRSHKHTFVGSKSFATDVSSIIQSPRMLKQSVLSPLSKSPESVKLVSLDSRSPNVNSEKITPCSTSSIKYVSSGSKSPKCISQKWSNSTLGAEICFKKTDHNSSLSDSDYDTVLKSIDSFKSNIKRSRKNLSSQFEVGSIKGPSEMSKTHISPVSPKFQSTSSKTHLRKDSLIAMQRLLDDSFEVSDSVFQQANVSALESNEKDCERQSSNQDCMIPGNSDSKLSCSDGKNITAGCSGRRKATTDTPSPGILVSDKVTPLPDYSGMKTPALKKELSRFGLKPSLGRRKAKLLLRYIYDQTHPEVPDSNDQVDKFKQPKGQPPRSPVKSTPRTHTNVDACNKDETSSSTVKDDSGSETDEPCSQMSTNSSISSAASLPEESYHETEDIATQELSDSGDVRSSIRDLILGNPELHKKVLMYEPIFLEDLMAMLKVNGIKSKTNTVMDYLDEQCITFRTNSWRVTNEKRRQKLKSPKKRREQQSSELPNASPSRKQTQVAKKRGRPKKINN